MARHTHRWTATLSLAAALALGIWAIGSRLEARMATVRQDRVDIGISLLAFQARVVQGDVLAVDVRDRASAEQGRIAGSVHVALAEIEAQAADLRRVSRGRLVVTYCSCPAESSSLRAARVLVEAGVPAQALVGGYPAWVKAGGATESGPLRR